ncbi:DUF7115 domain-containing protein [Natronorarus salvus]|uniref:DUF7115 domain-containing protein n=1 Tax=Natronorarus salvus TaxID=3117733 RepID=UPI002F25F6D0
MDVPALVEDAIDPGEVVARIDLGGGDELFVQIEKTVLHRTEGLLSDESVEVVPHDAERVTVEEGRKKATIDVDCGIDGVHPLSVPASRVDDALHAMLSGVLATTGVIDPDERTVETFRFSELTVVVTTRRLLTHVGAAVWDEEAAVFDYERVTDLAFEEGSVATEVVLTHDGRRERFKAPNETARVLEERLTDALVTYHDVESIAEIDADAGAREEGGTTSTDPADPFDSALEPLNVDPPRLDDERAIERPAGGDDGDARSDERRDDDIESPPMARRTDEGADPTADEVEHAEFDRIEREGGSKDLESAGFEPAGTATEELAERIDALRRTAERQTAAIERQEALLERLIDELSRTHGR